MRRRLDRHLNELAMAAEGFNLEDGQGQLQVFLEFAIKNVCFKRKR